MDFVMDTPCTLHILGTGNAMVTRCYNTCFAINTGKYFLVDAGGGNGILTQLDKAGINIGDLEGMFITHGHTDHILGALWIIRKIASMIGSKAYNGTFPIYCHDEVAEMLITFCRMTLKAKLFNEIGRNIIIHIVGDGDSIDCAKCRFTFFDIHSTKKKQFGFKAILPCGFRLGCMGDEPYNELCHDYVADCDLLMSEAFCLYDDRDRFKPYEKHHSTARDAAHVATTLNARNLLLYHTEDSDLPHRKARYTAEAATCFKGGILVPDDLEVIDLKALL